MHDFRERLTFSEGVGLNKDILEQIAASIPCADKWEKATTQDDRNGTDYWLLRKGGLPPLSFDMKNRDFCPIERFGKDDACIETWSVWVPKPDGPDVSWNGKRQRRGVKKAIGWTFNIAKRTDWIVYTWPKGAGRRFWIVPFPFLCQAARLCLPQWLKEYPELAAENSGYQTLSIYPQRIEIRKAVGRLMSGVTSGPPLLFSGVPLIGEQLGLGI